ncbi:anti-phage-associated DUF3780 domain-containing protein [Pyxidicoccus sp. 3LFB2]
MTRKPGTIGFGSPDIVDPDYLAVEIPRGSHTPVLLVEHFGIAALSNAQPETLDRVELERPKWTLIADTVRKVFNERLKEKGLPQSRWSVGENRIERVLGKELCVLAWAIEKAPEEMVPVALTNWVGLKPEERWWLFTMTAAASGGIDDGNIGWRKALRYALTENPVHASPLVVRPRRHGRKPKQESMGLFDAGGDRPISEAASLPSDAVIPASTKVAATEAKADAGRTLEDISNDK